MDFSVILDLGSYVMSILVINRNDSADIITTDNQNEFFSSSISEITVTTKKSSCVHVVT